MIPKNCSENLNTKISLRILEPRDVSESYLNWYKDKEVVRYSDNQYRSFTFNGQKEYVLRCFENPDVDLYGIFLENLHIGNILIRGVRSFHRRAELTYVIGEREYWNRGVASYAISLLIDKCHDTYKLNKLFAGIACQNIGSQAVMVKNGFVLEGVRKAHLFYNNEYYDQLDYGLLLT